MTIGISTYAYQWRSSPRAAAPMTLEQIFEDAHRLGLGLVQVCDWSPLATMTDRELDAVRAAADACGHALETGTKGVDPAHLLAQLRIAERLGARVMRSMLHSADYQPDREQAEADLRSVIAEFEAAGITLALETYEQVPTATLVEIVDAIDSERLGICLDPGNVIAALEHPDDVIDLTAARVVNVHVKDFVFSRNPDMVGFRLAGAPMGHGLLDYAHLRRAVQPERRGINLIIEQWVPWQADAAATITIETEWAEHAVRYLTQWSD